MRLYVSAAVLLLTAAGAYGAGDHELLAAEQELKIAKDHLQAAEPDYAGHRRAAVQFIDRALKEIRQGIEFSRAQGAPGAARERKPKRPEKGPAEAPDED